MKWVLSALSLAAGALVLAGCDQGTARPASPAQRVSASRPAKGDVPVVYDMRLCPKPLTAAQKREFLSEAARLAPPGRDAWFIWVHANQEHEGELSYNASVYYAPDVRTARLRKGKLLGVSTAIKGAWPAYEALVREEAGKPVGEAEFRLSDYWQVSRRGEPFSADLAPPSGALMPFAAPSGVSDQEVVEIVDFARTSPKAPGGGGDSITITIPGQFDGTLPILAIRKWGDLVEVTSGTVQGLLAGAGQVLRCMKKGKAFVVLEVGLWVS